MKMKTLVLILMAVAWLMFLAVVYQIKEVKGNSVIVQTTARVLPYIHCVEGTQGEPFRVYCVTNAEDWEINTDEAIKVVGSL